MYIVLKECCSRYGKKKKRPLSEKCHVSPLFPVCLVKRESESEVAQSCPTLCDPIDCSLPGSSVHGIFQARVLEWVAISLSRGSSQPRDQTQARDQTWVSRPAGRCLPSEPPGKPSMRCYLLLLSHRKDGTD